MRAAWLTAALAAFALSGQIGIIDDAADDVLVVLADSESLPAGPVAPHVDLIALTGTEEAAAVRFEVRLSAEEGAPLASGVWAYVGFRHQDTEFLARIIVPPQGSLNPEPWGTLYRRPVGAAGWDEAGFTDDETVHDDPVALRFTVAKASLADGDGATPFAGRSLEDFWAEAVDYETSIQYVGGTPPVRTVGGFYDRMPNHGTGGRIEMEFGPEQGVDILLTSDRPFRASNGEETTIVYQMEVLNQGDAQHDLLFEVRGTPETWSAHLPLPVASLPPGQTIPVQVVVAVPFAHSHGSTVNMTLHASSLQTGETSALTFGVVFLDTPQPAGHHDELFLHTSQTEDLTVAGYAEGSGTRPYMNTLRDDPLDTGRPIRATSGDPGIAAGHYYWCIRLSPSLALGLDVEHESTGRLRAAMQAQTPISGTLHAQAVATMPTIGTEGHHCTGDADRVVLAASDPIPVNLERGGSHDLDVPLVPEGEVDVLHAEEAADLFLEIDLFFPRDGLLRDIDAPILLAGGEVRLPLEEYHDPVPPGPIGQASFAIPAEGLFRAERSPGSMALFETSLDGMAATYELTLIGTRLEWFETLPAAHAEPATPIFVAVRVPDDAPEGAIANAVLLAHAESEVALARFVVEVGDGSSEDDRTRWLQIQAGERASPVSTWLAAGALLCGWLAVRRRHIDW